ncbi:hypothetical protein NDI86_19160 [Halomicroarcula sp. S3CR25-11]|uniref:Uncharacterized protein n=1 Tax=Haloarcula onubensis TaxID=2950539 RepID=A0ABU2FTW5_9EURY|nr:hypothetical protein [Halomicroarcula sp. S3CR25-11]
MYLRRPVADGTEQRQTSVLGRADALRQQGLVDGVDVTYWHRVATGADPREMADIETLERWAADNGCSLAPAFDRHDRHSVFTGDDTVVTLPVACVAYWEGDRLLGVYPHRGPCGHCTLADGLDRIEAALQSGESLHPRTRR